MRFFWVILIFLFSMCDLFAQSNVLMSQYFQNMPAFAPGLTGANDYLDLRTGYRQQWVGFEGAPKTFFLSGYGMRRTKSNPYKLNSARVSNITPYEKSGVKIGLGGYILFDELGAFRQWDAMSNIAVHVPIRQKTYVSLGISSGVNKSEIDFSKLYTMDPNDTRYESFLNNGPNNLYLKINSGIAVYSPKFYISYAAMHLVNSLISGNEPVNHSKPVKQHNILGGYRVSLSRGIELIPNGYVKYTKGLPILIDAGTRIRFEQNLYAGLSYRNDNSVIGMAGCTFDDRFKIGYSYEYKFLNYRGFNSNSHEVVIGVQLFNHNKYTALW